MGYELNKVMQLYGVDQPTLTYTGSADPGQAPVAPVAPAGPSGPTTPNASAIKNPLSG